MYKNYAVRIGLFLVFLILTIGPASASWWNGSWAKKVDNQIADGARPYQLSLNISNSTGTNNATHVYCNGNCKVNFTDIRFTLNDTTVLPHWIEDNSSGKVWVNVTANGTINMYYGNPTATSTSNGDTTFYFFDDFPGTSLNLTKWTLLNGTITVADSEATVVVTANKTTANSIFAFGVGYAIESKSKAITGAGGHLCSGQGVVSIEQWTSAGAVYTTLTGTADQSYTWDWTTYARYKSVRNGTTNVLFYANDVLKTTHAAAPTGNTKVVMRSWQTTGAANIIHDFFFVRKYASPEPTWATWGSEQTQPYIPPNPINLANTTGNYWVNHTWQAGIGNVTNSYNVSVNGTWYNGTANTYFNNSVGVSGWSNITVWAFNSSGSGLLSLGNVSQNTRAPGLPDLAMTQANISFSYASSQVETGDVKENANVNINASVYNNGSGDVSNVKVSFYDGFPGSSNNIANTTIAGIAFGSSQNATIYWNSLAGTHNISVKVDPDNTITESDETNNNASKFINVSAWQKYYGNVSGNLSLKDQPGNFFSNWTWGSLSGNIFITNVSSLNFSNLQALGRNKSGGISQNNFSRADVLLNLTPGSNNATGFTNNNVTQIFSTDGTNPRNTTSFIIYGNTINNVAIVNSTNVIKFASVENTTFLTGVLWDTTWDSNGNYGDEGEKLVFVTKINVGNTGLLTTPHDYEIAIPSSLKGAGVVYFFVELK